MATSVSSSLYNSMLILSHRSWKRLVGCCCYRLGYIFQLIKVERLGQKLHIMSYIGNFFDTCQHLQPVSSNTVCLYIMLRSAFSHGNTIYNIVICWIELVLLHLPDDITGVGHTEAHFEAANIYRPVTHRSLIQNQSESHVLSLYLLNPLTSVASHFKTAAIDV